MTKKNFNPLKMKKKKLEELNDSAIVWYVCKKNEIEIDAWLRTNT